MTETTNSTESGFALERVFADELQFTGHPVDDSMPESEAEFEIGWDWAIEAADQFSVRLRFRVLPTKARPETVAVALAAGFIRRGTTTVSLLDFVSKHGPALMMPFVRETISSLTSRGLHGALLLPPFNVLAMMRSIDSNAAEGMRQLQADAALAAAWGVEVTPPRQSLDSQNDG